MRKKRFAELQPNKYYPVIKKTDSTIGKVRGYSEEAQISSYEMVGEPKTILDGLNSRATRIRERMRKAEERWGRFAGNR